jgi:hypothetical protein
MYLGTKFCKFLLTSNDFVLAFGHLGEFSVSSSISFSQLLYVGVDNALIKRGLRTQG